ncbi:MAG TPA: hypothetical protein VK548_04070 [Candidatus Acidoferrum sp.]|nr:hypothetical protein [Candidatus Acidoferrum sp.]
MNGCCRVIACTLAVVVFLGMLPSRALAQQPAPAAPASPPAVVEVMPAERPAGPGADVYDVGATVITVARAPFNAAICALGAVAGLTLFAITLGSGYRATTRTIEEGCAHRWIVRGDDIRPRGGAGIIPDLYQRR